jgi:short-subunit dehydrogenase
LDSPSPKNSYVSYHTVHNCLPKIALLTYSSKLKNPSNFVIATARSLRHASELQELAAKYPKDRVTLVQLNLANIESIERAASEVEKLLPEGLDVLVGNAGANDQPIPTFENLFVVAITDNTSRPGD